MNNIDFNIRKLKEEDLVEVAKLYTLFWGDKMNLYKMKEKFLQISQDDKYIFLVAEKDQNIVGTIQGIICEELYGECFPFLVMENFVVDENHQGNGIGRKLLYELERIGMQKNCSQIVFITESDRKDTVKFYEKVGFDSISHKGFKKKLK
ncbi:MAG: GNAT family N-acetyltransferase [Desulfobulbaceae bacterium]|nr:GNAT family N-acetyltransferase [Desulfobulbaceae bacterium]